jgi:GT2 family glycosyltransferase
MRLTHFLRYINEYGLQFGYSIIEDGENLPFNFFYTSNVSLPREALEKEPFRLEFPYPAWEDTELSYRMSQKGIRMVYEPDAVVDHDHPTNLSRFKRRQEMAGYSAVVFYQLHPELGTFLGLSPQGPPPLPKRFRQLRLELLAHLLQHLPIRWPWLWEEVLRYHYIVGLQRGWSDRAGETKGEEI